ncbi:hypothetical protein C8Q80DRAFT_1221158 [Daedaleopsis nitida]|nr:hypothetical protein C8Q80DRAFT_1221158 [Daedaleopsis nitida]
MPPRLTRYIPVRRVTGKDALSALIATSSITREIADLLQFAPAKAAASILLVIFETIKNVQTNRHDCHRLARRCLSLLVEMREQLQGHEESAPPSLLKAITKFEETLDSIRKFMQQEADQKWGARLMRKSTIESALADYNAALDDATRAFQIATLINIHLAVGDAAATLSSTKGASKKALAIAVHPRESVTLPPYSSSSAQVITDVEELTMSPVPESSFEPVIQREASIDLIDLSTPAAADFQLVQLSSGMALEATIEVQEEDNNVYCITEHHGFNRYHQSQFRFKGKSRNIKEGWWAGGVEGQVDGQKSLMLRYEGDRQKAMRRWVRDVKLLQNVFHANLPQMVGYSNDETPTPFILLANVQTRLPQALLLDAVKNASLARCAQLMLQLDAAIYLQRQLDLSDSKIQDYVENASYRVDAEQTVVMGLPPPEIDRVVSWRNYGLAHSIRDIYLKVSNTKSHTIVSEMSHAQQILPNRGLAPKRPVDMKDDGEPHTETAEVQRKVNHLTILARALLPSADNISNVQERLHKFLGSIDEDDDEEPAEVPLMSLRQIRKAAFAANVHQQSWFENENIKPHKYSVGDLGYIPKRKGTDEKDWGEFVVLCNVLQEGLASLEVTPITEGKQGGWQNGTHRWDDMNPYELPGDIYGWTVVVPPEADFRIHVVHTTEVARVHDAWNFLLDAGKAMAETYSVQPEDLILITRAGIDQRFRVRDLRRVRYWPASVGGPPQAQAMHAFQYRPSFQQGHHAGVHARFGHQSGHQPFGGGGLIPGQDLAPKVFYLFTSADKEHEPYFSQTPVPKPPPKGEKPLELDPNVVRCFALLDITYGFLNYVQLHPEDFAD